VAERGPNAALIEEEDRKLSVLNIGPPRNNWAFPFSNLTDQWPMVVRIWAKNQSPIEQ
jgi:hypothetical protein